MKKFFYLCILALGTELVVLGVLFLKDAILYFNKNSTFVTFDSGMMVAFLCLGIPLIRTALKGFKN